MLAALVATATQQAYIRCKERGNSVASLVERRSFFDAAWHTCEWGCHATGSELGEQEEEERD